MESPERMVGEASEEAEVGAGEESPGYGQGGYGEGYKGNIWR
jgi:hypothetical protein